MELTGFTEEQLTVRDAISAITYKFPNTYWQECDQNERDPKEFHAALAKDGWLGIALPEQLGGAGLGQYIMSNVARDQSTDCEQESRKLQ
jgi:acyl-CoA dehydrogenase